MSDNSQIRRFEVRNSEKCFRFKPEAFMNHAPTHAGIYELVAFDENQNPKVLYVGAAFEKSIQQCLEDHATGELQPSEKELTDKYQNLYFDYLTQIGGKTLEDAKDVYWWLLQKYKPPYNDVENTKHSERPGTIEVVELD